VVSASLTRLALGGAVAGWLFSAYGYVPNAEQTAQALLGIRLTASVYPSFAFGAAMICLFFYPITKDENRKIANELEERRKHYYAPALS
jgi:glycoside/pentoside/hexuronide:cation symporter, GPH family